MAAIKTPVITTMDLLRHGEPEGGEIFRGSTDVALTQLGWQQMQRSLQANASDRWQAVVSSPLKRCQAFAQQFAEKQNIRCAIEPELREIDFGDWEGQLFDDVKAQYGDQFLKFWQNPLKNTPPNGEPMLEFSLRIAAIMQSLSVSYRGQHILAVVHGGVIRAILSDLLKTDTIALMRFEVPYACLTRIKIYHSDDAADWPQLVFHNR